MAEASLPDIIRLSAALKRIIWPDVHVDHLVHCDTLFGPFVIDILLTGSDGRRAGLCLQGIRSGLDNLLREWQSAIIIGDGVLDSLLWIQSEDVAWTHSLVLLAISRYEPTLITPQHIVLDGPCTSMNSDQLDQAPQGSMIIVVDTNPDIYFVIEAFQNTDHSEKFWRRFWQYCAFFEERPLQPLRMIKSWEEGLHHKRPQRRTRSA